MDGTSDVRLRPASLGDKDAVLALVPELIAFGPPPWRNAQQMTSTDSGVIEDALDKHIDGAGDLAVFVATSSEAVIGFVHVRLVVDYYLQTPQAHVADVVVASTARGLGVGSRLLGAAEAWAREKGCSQLTIAVFEKNADALALYERRGFQRETLRLLKPLA